MADRFPWSRLHSISLSARLHLTLMTSSVVEVGVHVRLSHRLVERCTHEAQLAPVHSVSRTTAMVTPCSYNSVYYAYGQAGTRFTNCYSEDSYAKMNGGVFFFSSQTSPVIDGWHGVNSTAVGDGGIMRHTPGVHVTIRNSVFEGSRAGRQSGIFSMGGRGMRAENVLIKDSVATLGEASLLSFGDVISNLTLDNTEGRTSALKFHYTGQDQADTSVVAGSARDIKVINSRGLTKGVIEVQQDFPNCMSISELAVRNSNGYTGGIFVGDDACINVDGLEMTDNIATHAGSIFYSSLSSLPSSIRNARFDRNRAESASGISTSGCAGTGLPSGGIFLNNGAAPTSASVGSCPSWITSPISLQNVTFADSYAEGAGALFYIDATVDDPTGSTACSLDSFCGNANCTATNSSAASYGNTIAGPPRSLILGSSGAVSAELTTRAVIPSRPIQLTFTLRDGFGSMIHGGLPTGTDVIVLRSNLTDATRTAAGSVCYPDCAPYSSDSSSIDVFDFVIDALPGSSVPVRFYTSPATTEVDVVFTMKDCDDDKTWSALHKQCIISSCPVGQYVSFASPTSLPSCSACPANCSERRFWTYSVQTTCSAEKVSRDVLFSYIGDTEGVCRTTTQKPSDTLELISSCGVGGDLPAPLSVDCDYMTASSAKIAVSVIAAICLLLAVVMIVLLVALKPSGGRHSMFSRAYNVSSCAGIVIAVRGESPARACCPYITTMSDFLPCPRADMSSCCVLLTRSAHAHSYVAHPCIRDIGISSGAAGVHHIRWGATHGHQVRPHVRLAIARVPAGRDAHVDQDVLRAPRSREQKPQVHQAHQQHHELRRC